MIRSPTILRRSRVDSEMDKRLDKIGTDEAKAMRGKAAIANARLAYKLYEEKFSSDRWKALEAAGAKPQRPLWASTSTKNPDYKDTIYVEELIAPGVVNTMPEAVIHAWADHGELPPTRIPDHYAAAEKVMSDLAAVGVDIDDVTKVLEDEGVDKFEKSFADLISDVETKRDALVTA